MGNIAIIINYIKDILKRNKITFIPHTINPNVYYGISLMTNKEIEITIRENYLSISASKFDQLLFDHKIQYNDPNLELKLIQIIIDHNK